MADESKKKRRAAVADRLRAMFKAGEQLPIPDPLRAAGEGRDEEEDEAPASEKTRRRQP